MIKQSLKSALIVLAILFSTQQPVLAEPSGSACHVTVQGGAPTVVLIDTQDLAQAQEVALIAKPRIGGVQLPVESVVQCIRFPDGGSLTDPEMQALFVRMDK